MADFNYFDYIILPLLIFVARICDVSIGTIRIILVSKGQKMVAPFLGFFEVLIWIIAISRIMQNLDNIMCYIGYAAGFATGNFVGMVIEEKLAIGTLIIRIISSNGKAISEQIAKEGFGVTRLEGHGSIEKVDVVVSIVKRQDLKKIIDIIQHIEPGAFYSIEEAKNVNKGIFPGNLSSNERFTLFNPFIRWRKGK